MVAPGVVRAVVTADNHLNLFYDRMPPQKLEQRRSYLRAGFKAAVEYALDWPADLFFIAGDLFDQPDPRNVDRAFVADCLAQLRDAGVRVYAVSGNHDTPRHRGEQGGWTPYEVYDLLGALTYFGSSAEIGTDVIEVDGLRVAIGGISPDPSAPAGTDPLAGMSWEDRPEDSVLGILLLHAQVEGYMLPESEEPVITLQSLETMLGVDVFLIGDRHRPAMRHVGGRALIIPGATERMTFGEDPGVPGFGVLELGHSGLLRYERIQLAGQARTELRVRAADLDPGAPLADLIARVSAVCTPETLVKLHLEGVLTRERYHSLALRELYTAINPLAFHFVVDTSALLLEDERHQMADRGVRVSQQEALRAYVAELMETIGEDAERQSTIAEAARRILEHY